MCNTDLTTICVSPNDSMIYAVGLVEDYELLNAELKRKRRRTVRFEFSTGKGDRCERFWQMSGLNLSVLMKLILHSIASWQHQIIPLE